MSQYIEVTGKTEDEAISNALLQLGLDRDSVSVEILDRGRKGFLGIGYTPAKVRVTYGLDEEEETPPAPEPKKSRAEPAVSVREPKSAEPSVEKKAVPEPLPAERAIVLPGKDIPVRKKRSDKPPAAAKPDSSPLSPEEEEQKRIQAIHDFLSGLLERLGYEATIQISPCERGRYHVNLEGSNLGGLIGHRGETLDAIQQLTGYAVSRKCGRVRISLNAEGYREKREKSLENLAKKTAARVIRFRRNIALEPMNAYERHVIHVALQEYPGVSTHSVGTDPNRRVVIAYEREKNNSADDT